MRKPDEAELGRRMKAGGTPLDGRKTALLWRFHEALREADATLNLTRIRAFDAMVEKHYIDSLLPAGMVKLEAPIMDLGSGGGFPGMPLAIAHPELTFKLVEGRRARAAFLHTAAKALGLKNVEVIARKLNPADEIRVRTVITRAFSDIADTLARVAGSVEDGGQVVFLKGPNCDEEIAEAARLHPEWKLELDRRYALPFSGDARRLVVYRRARATRVSARPTVSVPSVPARLRAPEVAIQSADNPRIKLWRRLHTAKGIHKEGLALLAGARYLAELVRFAPERIVTLIATPPERDGVDSLPALPELGAAEVIRVAPELMRELDLVSGVGPLALVRAPAPEPWSGRLARDAVTVFLATQNPENVGAILRTAEALNVRDVVLLRECASPYLPKTLRAAGPSVFRLRLFAGPGLADLAGSYPIEGEGETATARIVALDLAGQALSGFVANAPSTLGLVVGMEGQGTRALSKTVPRITIPLAAGVDSLNASVAVGIALYALGKVP